MQIFKHSGASVISQIHKILQKQEQINKFEKYLNNILLNYKSKNKGKAK